MRARQPDIEGHVDVDGVNIGYEVFGSGEPTLLMLPTWTIIHSRFWKMQVPYLADHFKVVTFDRPGNGRSDRPSTPEPYGVERVAEHALAVMDATDTEAAILVSLSQGAHENLFLAAERPERVLGSVFIGASLLIEPGHPEREEASARFFDPPPPQPDGWLKMNAQHWTTNYEDFVPTRPNNARTATDGHKRRHRRHCSSTSRRD